LTGAREPVRAAGVDVLALEEQPLLLIVSPALDSFGDRSTVGPEDLNGYRVIVSQQGSLMRWMVDDVLAGGVDCEIVAEVAHRTSILPMVMNGIGHAVMPSSWRQLAERAGLRTLTINPEVLLHVALLSRTSGLTPAAESFLEVARAYAHPHE
jgi:DNA-binding transcriptional LysR family regulator